MKRNVSTLYLCSVLALALIFGCSKKEESAQPAAPAAKEKAPKPAEKPATPVQKQLSSAVQGAGQSLDFRGRRDPFKPFAPAVAPAPAPGVVPKPRPVEDLLPIQAFEVAKFKVAGIIAGLTENRALVIDPNGKGYVVQKGMLIGNNDGRISRITSNSVEVVERYRDEGGRPRQRTIVLTLTKKR